jgi:hypothetical protein
MKKKSHPEKEALPCASFSFSPYLDKGHAQENKNVFFKLLNVVGLLVVGRHPKRAGFKRSLPP